MKTPEKDDIERRIHQLLDGELNAHEVEQLDAELRNDPRARKRYIQAAVLHSALQVQYQSYSNLPHEPIIPMDRLLTRHKRQLVKVSLFAAAALFIVSAASLWFMMAPPSPQSLASFHVAPGSTFTLTHTTGGDAPNDVHTLHPGSRLRLDNGTIEAEFDSGVRCVIKAPCELVALSNNRISLSKGVAWFKVPPEAVGFTVETPQFTIVDLGTEFGIMAPADGAHEVHVMSGKVGMRAPDHHQTQEHLVLHAGEARRVDTNGNFLKSALNASHFLTSLPKSIIVRNPNFELPDDFSGDRSVVGYGPIADWATSGEGIGVSREDQPFLQQPAHSGRHVAFIQGAGAISQSVSGFDPSKPYTVTYFVSERGLPDASIRTSVSLDLGTHSYSTPNPIVKTDAFRRIVSGPLAVFGPTANIEIRAKRITGDAALLVDSVSISRAVPAIPDGGFENPAQHQGFHKQQNGNGDGSLDGSAWTFEFGAGITHNNSKFSPPPAPEGSHAAILQGHRALLFTTVTGFEPGVTYSLSLEAAGRRSQSTPFRVMLGELPLSFANSENVTPPSDRYKTFTSKGFTTEETSLVLRIEATGEGTTFLDDLRFNFVAEADDLPKVEQK